MQVFQNLCDHPSANPFFCTHARGWKSAPETVEGVLSPWLCGTHCVERHPPAFLQFVCLTFPLVGTLKCFCFSVFCGVLGCRRCWMSARTGGAASSSSTAGCSGWIRAPGPASTSSCGTSAGQVSISLPNLFALLRPKHFHAQYSPERLSRTSCSLPPLFSV